MAFNWNKFPWTNLHDLNLDWIIQKVRELEIKVLDATKLSVQYVDNKISDLLTGAGDLTISKTGDIRVTANSVQVTGGATFIENSEPITLYDPDSKTGMTAAYKSSLLFLRNNQDLNRGAAIFNIRTPEEGEYSEEFYPHNNFAASVGYVKTAVNAVSSALATETENRTAGDNTLRDTINNVLFPLLYNGIIKDFHVTGTVGQDRELTSVTFGSEHPKSELDNLLTDSTKVRLVVELSDETRYFNMCYKTATEYGFSGMYKATDNAATTEMIVYNGTTFAIH